MEYFFNGNSPLYPSAPRTLAGKETVQAAPKSVFKPSIIVPTYNSEKNIPTCLTSFFKSAAGY